MNREIMRGSSLPTQVATCDLRVYTIEAPDSVHSLVFGYEEDENGSQSLMLFYRSDCSCESRTSSPFLLKYLKPSLCRSHALFPTRPTSLAMKATLHAHGPDWQ